MAITDIPILSMLRMRLEWSQSRQKVLSENVANSDTPHYRARDLVPLKFETPGEGNVTPTPVASVALARTEEGHLSGFGGQASAFRSQAKGDYETRPTGNSVSLEDEMMKVAANNMDYQAATAVYTHSLKLIKTALGKA
jgi:flagellar basal-body rod protein FlgB